MQRFFLAAVFAASLVTLFAVPQAAQASGQHVTSAASGHVSSVSLDANLNNQGAARNRYPYGQCTWWAAQSKLYENLQGLGNAGMWAYNARRHRLPVGYTPRVGATVVFAPRVQGAGGAGHVGHVVAVSGRRFELSEMNYYGGWPHGGWGRVDYRWAYAGGGVTFIY
jgi:surface antigen